MHVLICLRHLLTRYIFYDLGIPSNELVIEGVVSKPQLTPSVTTAKTTLGHSATVAARATSYKVCLMFVMIPI